MSKKIVIAGAGIGGLCAALALAQRGFVVEVFEQSAVLSEVGAGLQLSPNAMQVLRALGLEQAIKTLAFAPKAAVMRHYKSGKQYFSLPLENHLEQKYGASYLHIHRADLHSILQQACESIGVKLHLGHAVSGYTQTSDQVQVLFNTRHSVTADLLIGADGINSKVQACMLGPSPAKFTGQVAWRGVVATDCLPKNLVKPNANLWVGPGQHFVSYYVRGGQFINFVAVQERSDWQQESWQEEGDINELRHAFAGWHREVTELLAASPKSFLWALFDRAPLTQWTDNRVALLGDACHPMLPFLAQGAAMAIEDSYVLASCLSGSKDVRQALNSYQQQRLPRTADIQRRAAGNAAFYHQSSVLARTKLAVLSGLSTVGLSQPLAAKQIQDIYAYNAVEQSV